MKNVLSLIIFSVAFLGFGGMAFMNMTGASFNSAETVDVKHTFATIEEDDSQIKEANLTLTSAPQQGAVNAKYYALTQVLDNGVTSASDLVSNITSTTSITPVTILKWDPNIGYAFYNPRNPGGGGSTDFSINVGDPIYVEAEADFGTTYTIVGDVPEQTAISFQLEGDAGVCKYNFISIPLHRSDLVDAAALAADIGDVDQILEWDPNAGYAFYNPANPEGGGSTNFPVKIGYPYFVCMNNSKTWPVNP